MNKVYFTIPTSVVFGLVAFSWFPVCNDAQGPALAPSVLVSVAVYFPTRSYPVTTLKSARSRIFEKPIVPQLGNLWNKDVHYHLNKSLPLVRKLSQINPDHILQTKILNAHFNIIFPSAPRSSSWCFPLYEPVLFPVTHAPPAQSVLIPENQSKSKEVVCRCVMLLSNYQTSRSQKNKMAI